VDSHNPFWRKDERLRSKREILLMNAEYLQMPLRCLLGRIILTVSIVSLGGCTAGTQQKPPANADVDLAERFSVLSPRAESGGRDFDAHFEVTRKGRHRDSMVLTAPVTIHASLAGFSGFMVLKALATPVFNVGDGIEMNIILRSEGTGKLIYTRYFDAGRRAEDRDWISLSIPLELGNAQDPWLEIRVSGGPQGDYVADWLALSAVHIVPGNFLWRSLIFAAKDPRRAGAVRPWAFSLPPSCAVIGAWGPAGWRGDCRTMRPDPCGAVGGCKAYDAGLN
jgi:hypothetical protein